ncbi:hypothetical protein AWV63_21405 [Micromonospora rifamycinica]|nr:hypothetical protein AWV63_21405 [Micromonospora rifamycinica]
MPARQRGGHPVTGESPTGSGRLARGGVATVLRRGTAGSGRAAFRPARRAAARGCGAVVPG